MEETEKIILNLQNDRDVKIQTVKTLLNDIEDLDNIIFKLRGIEIPNKTNELDPSKKRFTSI